MRLSWFGIPKKYRRHLVTPGTGLVQSRRTKNWIKVEKKLWKLRYKRGVSKQRKYLLKRARYYRK